MVVKLNNGAVREIKKAEPIVEKRFTFNGDTLRMVAKANSSKEDITGIETVLRPIERIYAGVVYLKKEKDLGQKSVD